MDYHRYVVRDLNCECILGFNFQDEFVVSTSLVTDLLTFKPTAEGVTRKVKMVVIRAEEKKIAHDASAPAIQGISSVSQESSPVDPPAHVVSLLLKVRKPAAESKTPASDCPSVTVYPVRGGTSDRHPSDQYASTMWSAKARMDVMLPPFSILVVPVMGSTYSRGPQQSFLAHGSGALEREGVLVGKSLHSGSDQQESHALSLQLINTSRQQYQLKKGQHVAFLERVDVVESMKDAGQAPVIRQVSEMSATELQEQQTSKDKEEEISLSIVDKITSEDQSISAIKTPAQRKKVLNAILPFTHLFDDRNLGAARHGNEVVEHVINTGSHAPIYQHARR